MNIEKPNWTYDETVGFPRSSVRTPSVVLTSGLPACGKTTWAEDVVKRHPQVSLICRDDFRRRDIGYQKGKKNNAIEKAAKEWRDNGMLGSVELGRDVIIADTNLNLESRIADVRRVLAGKHYRLRVADFRHVSVEDCLKRDRLREHSVGADVIIKLFYQHLVPEPIDMYSVPWPNGAVFIDLDGTVAKRHSGRDHYAKQGFLDDIPNQHVIDMITSYIDNMAKRNVLSWAGVFVLTGRGANAQGRAEIEEWVERHFPKVIPGLLPERGSILIREEDDSRPDYIVKREMHDQIKKMGYTPALAFDDRPQVCRMWDLLGLNTIKVGPYYEF